MTVYLVGAGPGDAGLLTLRGAQLLGRADAVVHDRLVHRRIVAMAPQHAEIHDVGKRPGAGRSQGDIDALLVGLGRRYEHGTVVRLKGGDPYVFGRGGEEATALHEAGLSFEVVPGVSAPNGVLAYAGIPLTHRGVSALFTVVTGHGADGSAAGGETPVDWEGLARIGGTIVILMGVAHRAEIAARLIAGGCSSSTPVAAVENGTLPGQRTTRTTLGQLGAVELGSPATVVVGDVAALDLAWFDRKPLAGWTVVVTRTRDQASVLSSALEDAGALAIEVPMISLAAAADGGARLRECLDDLSAYAWVVFTSRNTVGKVFEYVRDARTFGSARVAAIGDGTASALADHGIVADLVPASFVSEALVEAFPPAGSPGERVLLPQAAGARPVLAEGLKAKGYSVEAVEAYRLCRPVLDGALVDAATQGDAVMFASASAALGWTELIGVDRVPPVACCIGPVSAAAARAAGIAVAIEASDRSIGGLVEALSDYAAQHGRPR